MTKIWTVIHTHKHGIDVMTFSSLKKATELSDIISTSLDTLDDDEFVEIVETDLDSNFPLSTNQEGR